MRYDISIIDDNHEQFQNFKNYSLNKLKGINITLFSPNQNLKDDLELCDLLIINIDFMEYFNKIKKYLQNNIYTIFLINEESDVEKISHLERVDTLVKSFDFDTLIQKITYYTNRNNENTTQKEEDFSNSIINNINYPIFSTDGNSIIFSNDHFLD